MRSSKTGRHYGEIVQAIRSLRSPFTIDDLPATHTEQEYRKALKYLVSKRQIKKVKRGKRGVVRAKFQHLKVKVHYYGSMRGCPHHPKPGRGGERWSLHWDEVTCAQCLANQKRSK